MHFYRIFTPTGYSGPHSGTGAVGRMVATTALGGDGNGQRGGDGGDSERDGEV